jgi:tRNA dimethylallyltransferase
MDNLPEADKTVREALQQRLKSEGLEALVAELRERDPEYAAKVDINNPSRVMRALEVCIVTGRTYTEQRIGQKAERSFNIVKIATDMPRDVLYDRINRRVDMMVADGLVEEARAVYSKRHLNSLQTVGYREMFDYFDGTISLDEAIELIKRNSRHYAKRQMTWFRRDTEFAWFSPGNIEQIIEYINAKGFAK